MNPRRTFPCIGLLACLCASLLLASSPFLAAQDDLKVPEPTLPTFTLEDVWQLFYAGDFAQAIEISEIARESNSWNSGWDRIIAESLLAQGRYDEAYNTLAQRVDDWPFELRFRMLLREAARYSGHASAAQSQLEQIAFLVNTRPRRFYYDIENVVVIGETALELGMEPRLALENFFRRAQAEASAPASAFLAAGQLALDKRDFKLASRQFQEGLKRFEQNPYLWSGLAASFSDGDRSKLIEYIEAALAIDPLHVPALLLLAEHLIDGESYDEALAQLAKVRSVNPLHPKALALEAVIHYLENDNETAVALRSRALSTWPENPNIDYTIGQKLSRNYWFSEGSDFQRLALLKDKDFIPARIQLAQDLLRLGRDTEGWDLAAAAHEADPYDIGAYNLVTLHDRLKTFTTLESERFLVRMDPKESAIYGTRVQALLESAYATLSERYGLTLDQKTLVEIFPNPADFETRTFGVPGNPGYLGVCFGPVFTINSPATRSNNWEAVLYHEFCHSITLALSRNRMPRWLSEGISVYEEEQANPAWGRRMTANYRDRILTGRMQPISNMSAAFMEAKDGDDIQYAYFQSSLIVEYLFEQFGIDAMRGLLSDLGEGFEMDEAFERNMTAQEVLDKQFVVFAESKAAAVAPGFKFTSPDETMVTALGSLLQKDYDEQLAEAARALEQERWNEAADQLKTLIEQAGYLPEKRNAHILLAQAYRKLGEADRERALLETVVSREAHTLEPIVRLLQIAKDANDDEATFNWSNAWLAINPMAITPQRALYNAAQALVRNDAMIQAGNSLIALGVADAPTLHYELAQVLQERDPTSARRHTLLALEFAPRFRDAYRLLEQFEPSPEPTSNPPSGQNLLTVPMPSIDPNLDTEIAF